MSVIATILVRMRASRLLSVLLLLQTRGRLTAQQLAAELEVSVRTIYRDMESLHAAGVPLYGDAGSGGGYQLLDGYRTQLTGLTTDEAEALFLAGLPGPAAELGLGAVVAAAQLKLLAALPVELRDRAGRIQQRFYLDSPAWYHDTDETPHLTAVAAAVWNQRRIEIRYSRWAAPTEVIRTLEPYGVVLKAGRWYLVARSLPDDPTDGPTPDPSDTDAAGATEVAASAPAGGSVRDRTRTYRVSEILDLRELAETFDRPADFDLADYWRRYLADFDTRRLHEHAVVRLSPHALCRLPRLLEPAVVRTVTATAEPPDADGWVRAVLPIESVDHATNALLPLGSDVEVLQPPQLRDRIATIVRSMVAIYGHHPSHSPT